MSNNRYMRISELVQRSGVPRSTIHFYLREGLLHQPIKTGKTMGYYDESHLTRLQEIDSLKTEQRMPIAFIKQQLEMGKKQAVQKLKPVANALNDGKKNSLDPKEGRRRDITRTGIKIFSAKGYHRTRIQDITTELDISTGTFYTYFNNKKELFIEVVNEVVRTIVGEAAEAIKGENDFVKRSLIRGQVFYKNYSKYIEILSLLRAEMASEEKWAWDKVTKTYHELTQPLIHEIQEAIEQKVIRKVDADLLAYALTGLIEILSLRTKMDRKYDYEDVIDFIQEMVLGGIQLTS